MSRLQFSVRWFLIWSVILSATVGLVFRWYFAPFVTRVYWSNGPVGREIREQLTLRGGTIEIEQLDIKMFYSTGKPSCEGVIGADIAQWKFWSPTGERISFEECNRWQRKDAGDGTFMRDTSKEGGRIFTLDESLSTHEE